MFTKELLAKYVNTYNEVYRGKKLVIGPHIVVRGSQRNYAQFLNYNFNEAPNNIWFEDAMAKAIIFFTSEQTYGRKPNSIGDMRYITVPYSIAWIGYKLNYNLDLYKIWDEQELDDAFKSKLHEVMIRVEDFIKTTAPGSLYAEWAKKEECWTMLKETSLDVDLSSLNHYIVSKSQLNKRKELSDSDINQREIDAEVELIKSIPIKKWSEISKIGSDIDGITQHLKDRAINILSTIRLNKDLSEIQRKDGIKILDIIMDNSPSFFDEVETQETTSSETETTDIKITNEMLIKMVEWDTKAKVLSRKQLQYVADYAYGLKKINDFHKRNLKRYLVTLQDAGFSI